MTPNRTGGSQNTSCIVPEGKKMTVLFEQSLECLVSENTVLHWCILRLR